jgi:hypothetical protein
LEKTELRREENGRSRDGQAEEGKEDYIIERLDFEDYIVFTTRKRKPVAR